mmetsp:Transcript_33904/g.86925  ORF Transcript_33904/g.86925 Transcript_33904/m.86925 type:complete len:362 (+) Transcript_33904:103-1188(+)
MGAVQSQGSCGLQVPSVDSARLIRQLRSGGMLLCLDNHDGRRPRPRIVGEVGAKAETHLQELFRVHDLNKDGVLEESELIQLNKKVAVLHYGRDADLGEVESKYKELFRRSLDPAGKPVPYATFRRYMVEVLNAIDTEPNAQEMIMEQFIAEATAARAAFHVPSLAVEGDAPFLSKISFDEGSALGAAIDTLRWDTPTPRVPSQAGPTRPAVGVGQGGPGPKLNVPAPAQRTASDRLLQSKCAPPPSWGNLPPTAGGPPRSRPRSGCGWSEDYGSHGPYGSGYASTQAPSSTLPSWGSNISAEMSPSAGRPPNGRGPPAARGEEPPLLPLPPPPPPAPPRPPRRRRRSSQTPRRARSPGAS